MSKLKIVLLIACFTLVLVPTSIAQRPDAPEFALRGEFGVGTRELTLEDENRPLDMTIWYPADVAEGEAEYVDGLYLAMGMATADEPILQRDTPYPVVIFSHGSGGSRILQLYLTEHLASHGFVVIAPNHAGNTVMERVLDPDNYDDLVLDSIALRPLDILRVIDFMDALNDDGDFAGQLDMEKLAVAGHSLGGYTAMSLGGANLNLAGLREDCEADDSERFCAIVDDNSDFAALRGLSELPDGAFPPTTDDRIDAVIALAPALGEWFAPQSIAAIDIPTLNIVGSLDAVTPPEPNAYFIHEEIENAPRALLTLENAGHYIFVDACPPIALTFGLFWGCSDPVWDMARAHDLINHTTTAFLRSILMDDTAAAESLAADNMSFRGVSFEYLP